MAASASFTIEGGSSPQTVAAGATVNLAVTSLSGVRTIDWSISGTSDPDETTPTISTAGTPDGATASFAMPNPIGSSGYSVIVKCVVNGGKDADGVTDPSLTETGIVGVNNANSKIPLSLGEKLERHSTHGIIDDLNDQLATGAGASATWADTLGNGATTGANNPTIDAGQHIAFASNVSIRKSGAERFYTVSGGLDWSIVNAPTGAAVTFAINAASLVGISGTTSAVLESFLAVAGGTATIGVQDVSSASAAPKFVIDLSENSGAGDDGSFEMLNGAGTSVLGYDASSAMLTAGEPVEMADEGGTPTTPASGKLRLYNESSVLKYVDDGGVVVTV